MGIGTKVMLSGRLMGHRLPLSRITMRIAGVSPAMMSIRLLSRKAARVNFAVLPMENWPALRQPGRLTGKALPFSHQLRSARQARPICILLMLMLGTLLEFAFHASLKGPARIGPIAILETNTSRLLRSGQRMGKRSMCWPPIVELGASILSPRAALVKPQRR